MSVVVVGRTDPAINVVKRGGVGSMINLLDEAHSGRRWLMAQVDGRIYSDSA